MPITIPPSSLVRSRLAGLPLARLQTLACESGVPFSTLVKIRSGYTANPGIETVRKFFPLIRSGKTAPVRRV